MTALRLALLELRRFRGQPLRSIAIAAITLVPLLYGALYLWANWDPYGKTDQVPVAVVNEDQGSTVDGKRLDAGSEFVDQLKATPKLDWNFVSADQAKQGMNDGDYYFAVVVPADFSQNLSTLSGADPERAYLNVDLDDANGYIAGIMADTLELELQNQINTAVYVTFAKTVFGDLSELNSGLADAADGSADLADGADQVNDGAKQLADGAGQANNGANSLVDGLTQLGDGAAQVSGGVSQINDAVQANKDPLLGSLDAIQHGAQLGSDVVDGLSAVDADALAEACPPGSDVCDTVSRWVEQAKSDQDDVRELNNTVQGLTSTQINQQAQDIQNLADGAAQVSDGINGETGAINGAKQLADGTSQLADGSSQLVDGTSQLSDGATELSNSLGKAADQLPSMSAEENAAAADILGTPVGIKETNAHPAEVYGRGLAPFFFAIALWVFGLVAYMLLRSSNPRAMAGKVSGFTVAVAGWLPALFLGTVGALLLYFVVDIGLDLDPVNPAGTIGLCVLAIAAFTAIAHFLRLAFDAAGDVLILVFLMLQLTSSGGLYPMETSPAFFQALHPFLPMSYLVDGLRVTISGGNVTHLWRDIGVLAAVTAGFVALSTFTAMRQRGWSMARLRPAIEL